MNKLRCMICGMEVNENNYNYNKEAFLDMNTDVKIIYCPFCGASEIYLSHDGKVYSSNKDNIDSSTLNILDHAVKLELFNGDFYSKASILAEKLEIKRMFYALSKIEMMHAKIHQRMGGFTKVPVLQNINYDKYKDDDILIEMAAMREKHAVEYYKRYYSKINDESIKKIFFALQEVEGGHIELVEQI